MERDERGRRLIAGAVLGGVTTLPLVALSYLGAQLALLPFFPFDIFDWLARVLPGSVIELGIASMVRFITLLGIGPISSTAKTFEQAMGIVLVIAVGAAVGIGIAFAQQKGAWSGATMGILLGVIAFLVVAGIELSLGSSISGNALGPLLWLALLIISWGVLLGQWLDSLAPPAPTSAGDEEFSASRRELLLKIAGGSLAAAVVAVGFGRWLEVQRLASGAGQTLSGQPGTLPPGEGVPAGAPTVVLEPTPLATETAEATLRDRVPAAPGTRPDLTATRDFYRIDIDMLPPVIEETSWKLRVTGLFTKPRALTFKDLLNYPAVTQPVTQACISNPVAGDLIGTVNYTGARLRDVLEDLGIQPQATALYIQSADGFYETVVMRDMMDARTLLVYGINGATLPVEHGFPLRITIPNRYGMKQPKWITSIEAVDRPTSGYWVDRGWSPSAVPQIISVIDAVAKDRIENGHIPVGGIAWAGDRGIQRVEVQVDNGAWTPAVLRTPPLGPLTWIQWRLDWPVVRGTHTFRVRAADGTGALQDAQAQDTFPNGATGYDSRTVSI